MFVRPIAIGNKAIRQNSEAKVGLQLRKILIVMLVVLGFATISLAQEKTLGAITSDPAVDAGSARPYELKFVLPQDGIARAEFQSEEFYAIILISGKQCTFSKQDWQKIQNQFPQNKVFMDRFGCDNDIEENIQYTNVSRDFSFIALYGGGSLNSARKIQNQFNLVQKFPGANIRKMRAVLVYP